MLCVDRWRAKSQRGATRSRSSKASKRARHARRRIPSRCRRARPKVPAVPSQTITNARCRPGIARAGFGVYWKCGGIPGITRTIVDVGIQDGVDYIDIHLRRHGRLGCQSQLRVRGKQAHPGNLQANLDRLCFLRLLQDDVVFDKHPLRLEISERGNDGSMLSGLNKIVFQSGPIGSERPNP